jgi:hypothetical protein
MNKKKVLAHLATFAAGAATGKVVSDVQTEAAAANASKEAFFNPDMVLSACEALTDRTNDPVVRLGAARYLAMVTVKSVRDIIAARTLRRRLNAALASGVKDFNPDIRKAAQQAMDALTDFEPTPEKQNLSSLKLKLEILRKHVRATPKQREEVARLLRAEGSDPGNFVTGQRKIDFMASCLQDLKDAGRAKDQLESFFVWLSRRPDKDLDLFASLCTEIDSQKEMYWLPGFTAVLEELQQREP